MFDRKCQDYVYIKGEYRSTMEKISHYLIKNKVKESSIIELWGFKIYVKMIIENNEIHVVGIHKVTLTNPLYFKTKFPKKCTSPNTARSISWKAWNSPVGYPNSQSKHDIKESEGNMFNPMFKEDFQGQKHPRRCVVAERGLPNHRKPKFAFQNV